MKRIPIFFTFDDNYVVPAAVAFHSLLAKAGAGVCYDMFVLHSDLTDASQRLLREVVRRHGNGNLEFRNTNGFLRDEWGGGNFGGHNEGTQFTSDAIVRCFGARFFPQYDRIVYSDVDVVFMDDVSELMDVDLDDKYLAAVRNVFLKHLPEELDHLSPQHHAKFKDSYFAGGLWVLNLRRIREHDLERRMIEIIKDDSIVKKWNDQDIMNIACDNQVAYLSLRYISLPYLPDFLFKEDFTSHYTKDECIESVFYPKILHYAAFKPWNANPARADVWRKLFAELKLPRTGIFAKAPSGGVRLMLALWESLGRKLRRRGVDLSQHAGR